jgi:CHAD domain-containing protein
VGFSFNQQGKVVEQVRQIAGEQVSKALEDVSTGGEFGGTVHRLRRRCKKLRGLLRLIEPRFDDFKKENAAFREAADSLAGTRDAAVMLQTFDALVRFDSASDAARQIEQELADAVRAELEAGVTAIGKAEQRRLLHCFSELMTPAARRVPDWAIEGADFDCLGPGLQSTYRRLRVGMDAAMDEQTADAFHEWRKDTKYHWHHVSLLETTAPELLQGYAALLDQLGELLGDHHNLAVLDAALAGMKGRVDGDIGIVRGVAAERQSMLAVRAFGLGRQLAAEKPRALRRRFAQYWHLLPLEK